MSVAEAIGDGDRSRLHRRLIAAGLAIGLTGAGSLMGGLLGFVALVVVAGVDDSGGAAVIAMTAASEVGYAAVALGYLILLADGVPLSRPTAPELTGAVMASVGLAAVGQAALLLVPEAGIDDMSSAVARTGPDPVVFLGLAVTAVVLVGPAEELLFRGAVQGTLRRVFGRRAAITGASVLFTAVHVPVFGDTRPTAVLAVLGVVFLGSVVLGYAFEQTGSLVVPTVIHSLYDGLLLVTGYLLATGGLPA